MNATTHQTLWQNILQFPLDEPGAGAKFSNKLAFQNRWTADFTARAVLEYKRFIFLCCVSPSGASPSPVVDEVWHLHLTYTQNYWKEFCGSVLQKEIHHQPSRGGPAEKEKHRQWYAYTLKLYEEVFSETPPRDIWPPAQTITSVATNTSGEASKLDYASLNKKQVYLLLLPFLLPLLFGRMHPFALTGPQFLVFYISLLAAGTIFYARLHSQKKRLMAQAIEEASLKNANLFAVSRFVFGRNKAIEAAVVDLVSKGILIAEPNERFSFYPQKSDAQSLATNPLAANLLHNCNGSRLKMKEIAAQYNEDLTYHQGLADLYRRVVQNDFWGWSIAAGVLLIGIVRLVQGVHRGYPVGYLQFLLFFTGFSALAYLASATSRKLFATVFTQRHNEAPLPESAAEPILAKFVFLGLASLAGTYAFANLETTFNGHRASGDGGSTSSCGSSGCGSSCGGGGGCGGCGGGD